MPLNSNRLRRRSQARDDLSRNHLDPGMKNRSNETLGKSHVARPGRGFWNRLGCRLGPKLGLGHGKGESEQLKDGRSEVNLEASFGASGT